MKRTRRTYGRDFKIEAIRLLESSDKNISLTERDMGIGKGNLWRWKREFAADREAVFPSRGRLVPEQEWLRQLGQENEILRQERDILHLPWRAVPGKKAIAIFSQPKQ